MSMIEKVAGRLFARSVEIDFKGTLTAGWEGLAPEVKDFWRALARAAIEAMREPTEEMVRAGEEEDAGYDMADATSHYQAMIDAAFEE